MTSLNILDTGDNYILALNNDSYNDAIKLYELLDITVNTIPTNLNISKDIVQFVYSSIGKIISYGFSDNNNDILSKLIIDIQKTVDYYKIKDYWYKFQYPQKDDNSLFYDSSCQSNQDPLTIEKLLPNNIKQEILPNINLKTDSSADDISSNIHVLYNTIYNISLVIDDTFIKDISNLSNNFSEFLLAKTIYKNNINQSVKDNLYKLFHKVSFNNISDLTTKIDAFYKLYDIPQNIDIEKINIEKIKVKHFLDWNYTISTDIDKKMKANDLYKEVINFLCISIDDTSAFKKRLAGYLLEFNLQKKRYSDAYYYYGIEKKNEVISLSLNDIEEKRASEKKTWFKDLPRINRLEPISTRKEFSYQK